MWMNRERMKMENYKKINFLLTEDQYERLKELLYDCTFNEFIDSQIAEFILKQLEENYEEYEFEEHFDEYSTKTIAKFFSKI